MVLISISIFIYTLYKSKKICFDYWLLPPVVFSFILLLGQIEYYFLYNFTVSDYVRIANFNFTYNFKVYFYHQILMVVCLLSIILIKGNNLNRRISISSFSSYLPRIKSHKGFLVFYYFVFLILLIFVGIHFYQINIDLLLMNNTYHLLKDADALNLGLVARLIHFLSGIIAIGIGAFVVLLFKNKMAPLAILLIPLFLYFLTLKVAANSRWGPLIIVSLIPFVYDRKSFKSKILTLGMGIVVLALYLGALFGRGSINTQGILPILSNIGSGFQLIGYFFPKIISTSLSSSWNFDLALQVFDNKDIDFDLSYKLLAFSPLISSMDGYDSLVDSNMIQIHTYAPINFIGELYFFGIGYMVFAFLVILFVLIKANKLFVKYGLISILPCATLYLFFFKMQQYPIRNNWRFLVISLIFIYIFDKFMKKRSKYF